MKNQLVMKLKVLCVGRRIAIGTRIVTVPRLLEEARPEIYPLAVPHRSSDDRCTGRASDWTAACSAIDKFAEVGGNTI
jgi:hypothetical protein